MEQAAVKTSFLTGGGEMGELTRNINWSSTSLGNLSEWPSSLKSTLGILLHSAFPMLLFWGEDLTVFYNDAFRPSLGVDGKHPAVGKKGREMWSEIWDFIGPLIQSVLSTGEPVYFEDQLVPFYRNGRIEDIYWTFSYSPAYDDDGRINGVFVTCTETTDNVLTVRSLLESEKRFQNLIREATVGIVVLVGSPMRVEIVNAAYGKLIDRTVAQLLGKNLFEVIPETEAEFRPLLENVMNTGQSLHMFEHPYTVILNDTKKDGYLNIVYQAYTDDSGKIAGVMALCQDVTQQVLSRKKVELSEAKFRTLMMASPVATTLFMGRNLVIDTPNQAFIEMLGKGPHIAGKQLAEIMPELTTENQPFLKILDDVFTTGKPFQTSGTQVMVMYNGKMTDHYYDFSYTPLRYENGDVYAILETAMDVTEEVLDRQKIEELVAERTAELAAANFHLQRSNAELEQFAYITSHDLQEPLRKVSVFSEMLEKHLTAEDPVTTNYLTKIRSSTVRMINLVRDVLTFSRLSAANNKNQQIDLLVILKKVLSDFDLLIEEKKALITYDRLPIMQGNEVQMMQLFTNLISNALKFTAPGTLPNLKIYYTDAEAGETEKRLPGEPYFKISFSDNGIGFEPENAEKIFHIFQRLHGNKEYGGTGIGLALCKKIVQNHQGHMYAIPNSTGSTFVVILPYQQSST